MKLASLISVILTFNLNLLIGQKSNLFAIQRQFSDQSLTLVTVDPQSGNLATISNIPFVNGTTGNSAFDPIKNLFFLPLVIL